MLGTHRAVGGFLPTAVQYVYDGSGNIILSGPANYLADSNGNEIFNASGQFIGDGDGNLTSFIDGNWDWYGGVFVIQSSNGLVYAGSNTLNDGEGNAIIQGTLSVSNIIYAYTIDAGSSTLELFGSSVATSGGNTLDDGFGDMAVVGSLNVTGQTTLTGAIYDATDTLTINPNSRTLNNATGTTVLNWQNQNLSSNYPFNCTQTRTNITGSVSGSAQWTMPFQGSAYKKFVLNMAALHDAGHTVSYPTSFGKQPYIYGDATALAVCSTSTTTFTIATTGAAALTGNVFVEGF